MDKGEGMDDEWKRGCWSEGESTLEGQKGEQQRDRVPLSNWPLVLSSCADTEGLFFPRFKIDGASLDPLSINQQTLRTQQQSSIPH